MTDEIRLAYPDVGDEELRAIASVLEDGMLTMGPRVAEFEAEIARACNTAHAVAVSSGTAALHLALAALDVGPGDEVIVLPTPSRQPRTWCGCSARMSGWSTSTPRR